MTMQQSIKKICGKKRAAGPPRFHGRCFGLRVHFFLGQLPGPEPVETVACRGGDLSISLRLKGGDYRSPGGGGGGAKAPNCRQTFQRQQKWVNTVRNAAVRS